MKSIKTYYLMQNERFCQINWPFNAWKQIKSASNYKLHSLPNKVDVVIFIENLESIVFVRQARWQQ